MAFGERRAAGIAFNPRDILILGLALLLGVTVLQIPLWDAKRAYRYHLLMPGEVPEPAGRRPVQFQVKHLLIGTFLLSVAMSPIRFVLPKESVGSLMPTRGVLVLIPAAIAVNLVATLPCLWGGFASTRKLWSLGVAWTIYSFAVTAGELAIVIIILGPPPGTGYYWIFCLLNFTQGLVVFAVMRIYRTLGYRLQRVPREAGQPP